MGVAVAVCRNVIQAKNERLCARDVMVMVKERLGRACDQEGVRHRRETCNATKSSKRRMATKPPALLPTRLLYREQGLDRYTQRLMSRAIPFGEALVVDKRGQGRWLQVGNLLYIRSLR